MAMNISCKFEKASYNIFFVRAVMVKSLYTLRWRRRRNEIKSIVSTGCYPVDTMIHLMIIYDVVNIFSMKNYKSSRKLRVGLNWYPGVNWSTTTTISTMDGFSI